MGRETFPKLENPVAVAPEEAFIVPAKLDAARGREAVTTAIRSGFLRPFDIASAEIEEPRLLYVPFWRVTVVGIANLGLEGRTFPKAVPPTKEVVVQVCARMAFPYPLRPSSLLGRVLWFPSLAIGPSEQQSYERASAVLTRDDVEVVEPDVDRAQAEQLVANMIAGAVPPAHGEEARPLLEIHASSLCLYPLYYARYTYRGEARRRPSEELFVAVSATSGEVVAVKRPSVARSVAAKVRRFLSFDLRR